MALLTRLAYQALLIFLLVSLFATTGRAQPRARESDLKATFLFNFTHFVEWPQSALEPTNAPFVIGILGTDPFGSFLDELVKNENVHGKKIVVKRFTTAEQAAGAHNVFISRSEESRLKSILSTFTRKPLLTVGDAWPYPGFARRGGMIGMFTEQGKLRIRINVEATKGAGLQVSSKLLRIAEVVSTDSAAVTGSPRLTLIANACCN